MSSPAATTGISTVISVDETGTPRERRVAPYDFRRPNKVSRDHVRALQLVHETFARQFSTILSSTLRALAPITISSIEQRTYDEYVSPLPTPTYMAILNVDPLPGQGIFHLPQAAAMEIIDRLLGGQGNGTHPNRPMTEIENGVLRGLLERVMRELTYAFESFVEVETRITSTESNPQFAQIAALSEMVVVATYDISIGDLSWEASLCFPFSMLQPALEVYTESKRQRDVAATDIQKAQTLLHQHLHDAPVDLAVQFNTVSLSASEIIGLQPGDVLPLRHRVDQPLSVTIGEVPCFSAMPGRNGRRLAAMVVSDPGTDRQASDEGPLSTGLRAALATVPTESHPTPPART